MIKRKERSGWSLASIILTGIMLFAHLSGIFEPLLTGDITKFIVTIFLIIFVGSSFTFGLLGYINKNPIYSLVSAIINTIYSFLGFIGFIVIVIGMFYAKDYVDASFYTYLGIFIFLIFMAFIGLIYLFFLSFTGYIGYFNQKKLNQRNEEFKDIVKEEVKEKSSKKNEK